MTSDRRRFKRFDVSLDVAFDSSSTAVTGITKNVSRSGLCFESPAFDHPLNGLMELRVKLPGQDSFVPLSGNVAWTRQIAGRHLVGLEFQEIDKSAKCEILDHAYDLWIEAQRSAGTGIQ